MEQKKRYKKGFILGKFLPPHLGHLHLVRSAMEHVEELTILVCTIKKEPIPGILRFQWMQELIKNARIVHVTDEVPSYPHEHPDFWTIWTTLLKKYIDPGTEIFFSSEDYGFEVAGRLGIKHILVDKERSSVPVSATAIRNNPYKNWDFIPPPVRPYYTRRIVLTGPESTGKTTLARQLAQHFNTTWVEEFGRNYYVEKGGKLLIDDIINIAEGQLNSEEQAIKQSNKLLFCDTDLIVTQIWSEIYFNSCPEKVIQLNTSRKYDLFLLMNIDIPWEDDGTREFPHLREWHFKRIKDELESRGLNYTLISGEGHQRLQNAIEAVTELIQLT
ncbi:MAG: AAA family ATPase [Bacteroidia bacterium]